MGGSSSKKSDANNANAASSSSSSSSSPSSSSSSSTNTQVHPNSVLVNVYEPSQSSSPIGGVYHSGVVLYDTEYTYAQGSSSLTGIHSHRPKQVGDAQWRYLKTENLGTTERTREEVRQIVQQMKQEGEWPGNAYSLTGKNCNHFSQALVERLQLTFPAYINRGARFMNAIGAGGMISGAGGKQQAVDLEGRPLREEDRQALVMEQVIDVCLDSLLDYKGISSLGLKSNHSLTSIIPVDSKGTRTQLKPNVYIETDADAQALLFLPFTKPVKLLSLLLRLSITHTKQNPATVKLLVNQRNCDFSDVDSITPTLICEIPTTPEGNRAFTKEETKEGLFEHVITLPAAKFTGVTFLTVYVESNHGAAQTRLCGLTVVGREK